MLNINLVKNTNYIFSLILVHGATKGVNILAVKVMLFIINPYNAGLVLQKNWRPKGLFQFLIIINDFVSYF